MKKLLLAALLMVSGSAFSGTMSGKIESITCYQNNPFCMVALVGSPTIPGSSCLSKDRFLFMTEYSSESDRWTQAASPSFSVNNGGAKYSSSMIMAAKMSGSTITIGYNPNICVFNTPFMEYLIID
ncbi:MAG: hypothetical protein HRU19_31125 [Pseudobacteriovorax sp.]|nr:hypothetical protein [Pseudobacteriovorax sp.]